MPKSNWIYPLFATCAVCDEPLQFDIDPDGTPGRNGDWGTIGENGGDYGCITGDDDGCDGHRPVDIEWRPEDPSVSAAATLSPAALVDAANEAIALNDTTT